MTMTKVLWAGILSAAFAVTLCVHGQETATDPVFPFGAVYFRKSNPPEQDWERDHKTAAQMGVNVFRHWFLWASIETSPGKYDWRDYDRMVELEAQNHIKVVIAELTSGRAPEWMWDKYPQARVTSSQGNEVFPSVDNSSATGNAPMCLDNEDVKDAAGKFLTALVERYRANPAVMGCDVWNEGCVQECFCQATQAKFREWLKAKYGTLEALEGRGIATAWAIGQTCIRPTARTVTPILWTGWPSAATTLFAFCAGAPI